MVCLCLTFLRAACLVRENENSVILFVTFSKTQCEYHVQQCEYTLWDLETDFTF